jgi:hypothetical protein
MSKSLQICFGMSVAGSLVHAGYEQILIFTQGFDGPLQDLKTYEDYEKAFQDFQKVMSSPNIYIDELPIAPLFCYWQGLGQSTPLSSTEFIRIINECDESVIWLSLGFHENLLLVFLIRLFNLYSLPLKKIKVRRVETQIINGKSEPMVSVGMIPQQGLKAAAPSIPLDQSEIDLLIKGWEAITSLEQETIEAYLSIPSTTRFQESLKDFRNRMPSSKTGLNRCQTELLEAYPLDQRFENPLRLIGTAMGKLHIDITFDLYIQWNLLLLTNLRARNPAFLITDPFTKERRISLTDFGRSLLEGKANWFDENPVDYYVGGLHIKHIH